MAKRFFDSELWQKEWFQDLTVKEKLLTIFIFENCDCAGIWNGNFKLASFLIGEKVSFDDIEAINSKKFQFEMLPNGNVFIPDFVIFQYGNLSENCKPHKPIIEKLKKLNLYERVLKGFPKGFETLEEKEKEKEKEKDEEKEVIKTDPQFSSLREFFLNEFEKRTNKRPRLSFQDSVRLLELANEQPDIKELIPEAIEKLKEIDFGDINFKPSANWLLKDNNFVRVLNGEFEKAETQKSKGDLFLERLRSENQC